MLICTKLSIKSKSIIKNFYILYTKADKDREKERKNKFLKQKLSSNQEKGLETVGLYRGLSFVRGAEHSATTRSYILKILENMQARAERLKEATRCV